jgi:hypothetical protein
VVTIAIVEAGTSSKEIVAAANDITTASGLANEVVIYAIVVGGTSTSSKEDVVAAIVDSTGLPTDGDIVGAGSAGAGTETDGNIISASGVEQTGISTKEDVILTKAVVVASITA